MQDRADLLAFPPAKGPHDQQCRECGTLLNPTAPLFVSGDPRADAAPLPISLPRAGMLRRALAEAVDRLLPLPFLAYLFPLWSLVVVAYHLLCDASPSGQSVGKWIFRLRVVRSSTGAPSAIWRALLRRSVTALGQAAYCSWTLVPFVIAYELVSVAFVWLSPSGRRMEDHIAGTQVINEGTYRALHRACEVCGNLVPLGNRSCTRCAYGAR
jgi:uncharacterized RDD family membrane protein YckC